ncbi:GTP-binding protein OBGC, chloroplastic [Tanacetum coccineum]
MFSPEIAENPFIVAYNKMDLPDAYEKWESFGDYLRSRGIEPFCISAINRDRTRELITAAYELVRQGIEDRKDESWRDPVQFSHVAEMVKKQRTAPINDFEISHDSSSDTWHIEGADLQRFVQMTNWKYPGDLSINLHISCWNIQKDADPVSSCIRIWTLILYRDYGRGEINYYRVNSKNLLATSSCKIKDE